MDDRWIDTVAREMTEARPPEDFTARVLARVAASETDRSWPMAARLAPAAVALLVAAALTVMMWPERPQEAESLVRSEPNVSALGGTNAEAPRARDPEVSVAPQPGTVPDRRPRTAFAVAAPQLSALSTTIEPPEPLTIAAMDVDASVAEAASPLGPLDVATLDITRLEIEPIGFPGDLQ